MLEKARQGGIGIYFEGDSITRRWGTSETAYKDFLANWNQNFFGWNAGNFAWGADRIQNILWRLEDGALVSDVTPGFQAILELMPRRGARGRHHPDGHYAAQRPWRRDRGHD